LSIANIQTSQQRLYNAMLADWFFLFPFYIMIINIIIILTMIIKICIIIM